jgi:aldehyde:ferredoxin oxidoreductase
MSSGSIDWEDLPKIYERLGGRSLSSQIMLKESDPECDPLGRRSFLIFAAGLFAGTAVPTGNRISVGGKSPLTYGIKESNAGGITALRMSQLGLRALIITGKPDIDKGPHVLRLAPDRSEILQIPELKLLGVYETGRRLRERFGQGCAMAIIGPAGERVYRAASIAHMDKDGSPTRFSGRGGLGAVMGAKGIKAIVIEKGKVKPDVSDPELFSKAIKKMVEAIKKTPITAQIFPKWGTPAIVDKVTAAQCLPTRNFRFGRFDLEKEIDSEKVYELITTRGGEGNTTHACMPGCIVRCSNVFPDENGKTIVGPIEYETIAMMGSNCSIGNLDHIAQLNRMANDLGVDTIEIGGAIGVAMESGELQFGSFEDAKRALDGIAQGDYLGRILGNGVKVTGEILGVYRTPHVKGQGMAGYDPRATKTIGVTYTTSPMGADHTGGTGMTTPHIDRISPQGHVANSRQLQFQFAGVDYAGICIMAAEGFVSQPEILDSLIRGRLGWGPGKDAFRILGRIVLEIEWEYNVRAGFDTSSIRIPEFMLNEKLPPHNTVFDVPKEEIRTFYDFLNQENGLKLKKSSNKR